MFPPMLSIDEERDEDGNVTERRPEYYLQGHERPMHNLIFSVRASRSLTVSCPALRAGPTLPLRKAVSFTA